MTGQASRILDDELVSILSSGVGDEDDEESEEHDEELLAVLTPRSAFASRIPVRAALAFSSLVVFVLGSILFASIQPIKQSWRGKEPGLRQHPQEALFATAAAGYVTKAEPCSARSMLDSPLIRKVAADNLMRAGRRLLQSGDDGASKAAVDAVYQNASARLAAVAPEAARVLSSMMLGKTQQDAVLSSVQLIGARRVQVVGLDVARAIRSSRSAERGQVRRDIEKKLGPIVGNIVKLRNQLVPGEVQKLWDSEHFWELTLDSENVHVMQAGGRATNLLSERDLQLDDSSGDIGGGNTPSPPTDEPLLRGADVTLAKAAQRRAALAEGAAQQARLLLHVLARMAKLPDKDVQAAVAAADLADMADSAHRSLVEGTPGGAGAKGLRSRESSCTTSAGSPTAGGHGEVLQGQAEQAMLCALRFGVQGIDALRASSNLTRVLPDSAFGSSGEMDVSSIGFT